MLKQSIPGLPLPRRQPGVEASICCIFITCFVYQTITLGCVGVGQSQNVHFVAESHGGATLTCQDFPGEAGTYDNIEFCNSANVSFTGIRFENCGPVSANVFFNYTSGILFDGCTFT